MIQTNTHRRNKVDPTLQRRHNVVATSGRRYDVFCLLECNIVPYFKIAGYTSGDANLSQLVLTPFCSRRDERLFFLP